MMTSSCSFSSSSLEKKKKSTTFEAVEGMIIQLLMKNLDIKTRFRSKRISRKWEQYFISCLPHTTHLDFSDCKISAQQRYDLIVRCPLLTHLNYGQVSGNESIFMVTLQQVNSDLQHFTIDLSSLQICPMRSVLILKKEKRILLCKSLVIKLDRYTEYFSGMYEFLDYFPLLENIEIHSNGADSEIINSIPFELTNTNNLQHLHLQFELAITIPQLVTEISKLTISCNNNEEDYYDHSPYLPYLPNIQILDFSKYYYSSKETILTYIGRCPNLKVFDFCISDNLYDEDEKISILGLKDIWYALARLLHLDELTVYIQDNFFSFEEINKLSSIFNKTSPHLRITFKTYSGLIFATIDKVSKN